MAALGDAVSVEDWQAIVQRARDDAKGGDAKSREWLGKLLLGAEPTTLLSIAATEERQAKGEEVEDAVVSEAARQRWRQRDEEQWREMRAVLDVIRERLPK